MKDLGRRHIDNYPFWCAEIARHLNTGNPFLVRPIQPSQTIHALAETPRKASFSDSPLVVSSPIPQCQKCDLQLDTGCSAACLDAAPTQADRQDKLFQAFREWRLARSEDFQKLAHTCLASIEDRKTFAVQLTLKCSPNVHEYFTATVAQAVPLDEIEARQAGRRACFLKWLELEEAEGAERSLCMIVFKMVDRCPGFPKEVDETCKIDLRLWSGREAALPLEDVIERINSQIVFLPRTQTPDAVVDSG
jgi:hypothetical protein